MFTLEHNLSSGKKFLQHLLILGMFAKLALGSGESTPPGSAKEKAENETSDGQYRKDLDKVKGNPIEQIKMLLFDPTNEVLNDEEVNEGEFCAKVKVRAACASGVLGVLTIICASSVTPGNAAAASLGSIFGFVSIYLLFVIIFPFILRYNAIQGVLPNGNSAKMMTVVGAICCGGSMAALMISHVLPDVSLNNFAAALGTSPFVFMILYVILRHTRQYGIFQAIAPGDGSKYASSITASCITFGVFMWTIGIGHDAVAAQFGSLFVLLPFVIALYGKAMVLFTNKEDDFEVGSNKFLKGVAALGLAITVLAPDAETTTIGVLYLFLPFVFKLVNLYLCKTNFFAAADKDGANQFYRGVTSFAGCSGVYMLWAANDFHAGPTDAAMMAGGVLLLTIVLLAPLLNLLIRKLIGNCKQQGADE